MKHPTEKDRVMKVVERAFNQMQFYGINVPDRIKNVEYFTRLILREIKRAEQDMKLANEQTKAIEIVQAQLAHLTRQTAVTMEALKKYGVHVYGCTSFHAEGSTNGVNSSMKIWTVDEDCDCGLTEAIKSHTTKQEGA